jgi:hypothetical protein
MTPGRNGGAAMSVRAMRSRKARAARRAAGAPFRRRDAARPVWGSPAAGSCRGVCWSRPGRWLLWLVYPLQWLRIGARLRAPARPFRGRTRLPAAGRFPEAQGALKFWFGRLVGQRSASLNTNETPSPTRLRGGRGLVARAQALHGLAAGRSLLASIRAYQRMRARARRIALGRRLPCCDIGSGASCTGADIPLNCASAAAC